MLSCHCIL